MSTLSFASEPIQGGPLYPRDWLVRVDTIGIDPHSVDIEFQILRTIKPEPNKCNLTIWNLSPTHRNQLLLRNRPNATGTQFATGPAHGVSVQVEAGYVGQRWVIFSGDLRDVISQRHHTDWKTTLSGDDGGRASREARIKMNFTDGTPIGAVLSQVAAALGLGLGNVANFTATAAILGMGNTVKGNLVLDGSASQALKQLTRSMGMDFSIQSGVLNIRPKGKADAIPAILLTPTSGLLGSPQAGINATVSLGNPQQFAPGAVAKVPNPPKPKSTSVIRFNAMLIPGLVPGRKVHITSDAFNGDYMLTECQYRGQSWGKQWHAQCVARVYQ